MARRSSTPRAVRRQSKPTLSLCRHYHCTPTMAARYGKTKYVGVGNNVILGVYSSYCAPRCCNQTNLCVDMLYGREKKRGQELWKKKKEEEKKEIQSQDKT